MAASPDFSQIMTQGSLSWLVVQIIALMKRCPRFSWINENTDTVSRLLNIGFSGISAIGVHWAVTGTLMAGRTITITIPPFSDIMEAMMHWFQAYVATETLYLVQKKARNGHVQTASKAEITKG